MLLRCESLEPPMSQLGQSRRFDCVAPTSALPPSTGIVRSARQVRFVPISDVVRRGVFVRSQILQNDSECANPSSIVQSLRNREIVRRAKEHYCHVC